MKIDQEEDSTAEYEAVAKILRHTAVKLDTAQMFVATHTSGKAVRLAIQQVHEALAAAAHKAKEIR